MEVPATIHQHPYVWGAGAFALIALYLYAHTPKASAAPTQTAVVSSGVDPTAAALSAQQTQTNAALTVASLQAQTQEAGITALQNIAYSRDTATTQQLQLSTAAAVAQSQIAANASVNVAGINANANVATANIAGNVANAATAASIYGIAASALTANNTDVNNGLSTSTTQGGVGYVTSANDYAWGNNYVEQWDNNWQPWMNGAIGQQVPIMSNASTSTGPATNATNNQLAELFNNVIRAGQGTAPMQTVTMQPSSNNSMVQTGTATIDPVFAVWNGTSAVPTITDITLNPDSQYGYTGSVFTPGMAAAINITPNAVAAPAVPAATTASLPVIQQNTGA